MIYNAYSVLKIESQPWHSERDNEMTHCEQIDYRHAERFVRFESLL